MCSEGFAYASYSIILILKKVNTNLYWLSNPEHGGHIDHQGLSLY